MIWDRVEAYNKGRDPERLALKYRKMAGDALALREVHSAHIRLKTEHLGPVFTH